MAMEMADVFILFVSSDGDIWDNHLICVWEWEWYGMVDREYGNIDRSKDRTNSRYVDLPNQSQFCIRLDRLSSPGSLPLASVGYCFDRQPSAS
jgi:hypothetical protein